MIFLLLLRLHRLSAGWLQVLTGPLNLGATWTYQTAQSQVMPSGVIIEGDGRIDIPSTSYCWLTNVCDALTAFNASGQEQVLQRGFDGAYSATYVYGVPATETYISDSLSGSLIITLGMGWKLDSGVFASQLMGVNSFTGQVMWNVTGTGAIYGDVVPRCVWLMPRAQAAAGHAPLLLPPR